VRGRGPRPNLAASQGLLPVHPSPPAAPGPTQASGLYSTAGASPGRAGSVVLPAASPPRPVVSGSPFSPQPRALCEGEGVWVEGMYLCVVTEPMPPFAIVAASRGWLQFCGFDAKEVKGRTLSMLQGPATERVVAAKLVSAAHQGVATDAVLVNYTKHCLAFRNHVRVHPFTKDGVLEGFKVIAPPAFTPSARSSTPQHPSQQPHSSLNTPHSSRGLY